MRKIDYSSSAIWISTKSFTFPLSKLRTKFSKPLAESSRSGLFPGTLLSFHAKGAGGGGYKRARSLAAQTLIIKINNQWLNLLFCFPAFMSSVKDYNLKCWNIPFLTRKGIRFLQIVLSNIFLFLQERNNCLSQIVLSNKWLG